MTSVVNKKRVRISSPGSDPDDRIEEKNCYVCDGKDNWVLVCHGEECLISIHQSCTCVEPDFDEFGNFFCPYCWYKRLLLKSLKLRDKLSRIGNKSVVDLDGVSENVDESYEKFMAMEKDQRRKEVATETQSQELGGRFGETNHEDEFDLASDMRSDGGEQIEHPIATDNGQELALIIHKDHNPIEAQPVRSVPPKNGTTALHVPEQRKRKRVFWTREEEEMLLVGVQKFPGIRNIPWRKILEFGRDVFHEDRAPSDLKDKWKTINKMCGKPPTKSSAD